MADNVLTNQPSSVGAIFATDEVDGIHHQKVLVEKLVAGVPTVIDAANPLPVSGTVAVSNPTANPETGLSKESTQLLVKAKTDNLDIALSALRDALKGGSNKTLTDIVNALASVPVTGTFFQATQPISAASLPLATGAATEDVFAKYKVADIDSLTTVKYYGFLTTTGKWYILKEDLSAVPTAYRYVNGSSGYAAAFTARASQTYVLLSSITNLRDTFGNSN